MHHQALSYQERDSAGHHQCLLEERWSPHRSADPGEDQASESHLQVGSHHMHSSMGVEVSGDLVTSTLLVNNAVLEDAGPYSCTLPVFNNKDFPRARATVHVIHGETCLLMYQLYVTPSQSFRGPPSCTWQRNPSPNIQPVLSLYISSYDIRLYETYLQ